MKPELAENIFTFLLAFLCHFLSPTQSHHLMPASAITSHPPIPPSPYARLCHYLSPTNPTSSLCRPLPLPLTHQSHQFLMPASAITSLAHQNPTISLCRPLPLLLSPTNPTISLCRPLPLPLTTNPTSSLCRPLPLPLTPPIPPVPYAGLCHYLSHPLKSHHLLMPASAITSLTHQSHHLHMPASAITSHPPIPPVPYAGLCHYLSPTNPTISIFL